MKLEYGVDNVLNFNTIHSAQIFVTPAQTTRPTDSKLGTSFLLERLGRRRSPRKDLKHSVGVVILSPETQVSLSFKPCGTLKIPFCGN